MRQACPPQSKMVFGVPLPECTRDEFHFFLYPNYIVGGMLSHIWGEKYALKEPLTKFRRIPGEHEALGDYGVL